MIIFFDYEKNLSNQDLFEIQQTDPKSLKAKTFLKHLII